MKACTIHKFYGFSLLIHALKSRIYILEMMEQYQEQIVTPWQNVTYLAYHGLRKI